MRPTADGTWRQVVLRRFTMYDSVDLAQFPPQPAAVAGYVGGLYPTFPKLLARFPKARRLSIAVNAGEDARCLDIEQGDAKPEQAAPWVRRQIAAGRKKPVVYCSLANAAQVLQLLRAADLRYSSRPLARRRNHFRLWTAHYTHKPHICGPGCGFDLRDSADATQWTDKALGRNLDASECRPGFL